MNLGHDPYNSLSQPERPVRMRLDDPLAASIRVALDARRLGWSPERTEAAMLRAGFGIDVQEHAS